MDQKSNPKPIRGRKGPRCTKAPQNPSALADSIMNPVYLGVATCNYIPAAIDGSCPWSVSSRITRKAR